MLLRTEKTRDTNNPIGQTELPILRDGASSQHQPLYHNLRKWQHFSCIGRSFCNIKRDSKPFLAGGWLNETINLAVCSTEDVVLIKGAAVASNTSHPLDLVEAQDSPVRETIKCLSRRLPLLGHILSLEKVACPSQQEHRSELAANSLLLGRFYLSNFCDPKDLVLALCYSSTKDDTDLLGMTWLQNTPKGKILTRHRKGVSRVAHPNQIPKATTPEAQRSHHRLQCH